LIINYFKDKITFNKHSTGVTHIYDHYQLVGTKLHILNPRKYLLQLLNFRTLTSNPLMIQPTISKYILKFRKPIIDGIFYALTKRFGILHIT